MAKHGAATTGGTRPSNRSPLSGSSAETRGLFRMDLDADVMRNEAHDAFGVCGGDAAAGIFEATRQTVDPQATVRVEHHFDDARIFEISRDRGTERGAQHARTAGEGFRPERDCRHMSPARRLNSEADISAVD